MNFLLSQDNSGGTCYHEDILFVEWPMEPTFTTPEQAHQEALAQGSALLSARDDEHRFVEELYAWRSDVDSWGIHQALNAHRPEEQQALARWRMAVALLAHHSLKVLQDNEELMGVLSSSERPYDPRMQAPSSMVEQMIPIADGLRGTTVSSLTVGKNLGSFLLLSNGKSRNPLADLRRWFDAEGGKVLVPARLIQLEMVLGGGFNLLHQIRNNLNKDNDPCFSWGPAILGWINRYQPNEEKLGHMMAPWGLAGEWRAGFCSQKPLEPLEEWIEAAKNWTKMLLDWTEESPEGEWARSLCNANGWLINHLSNKRAMAEDLHPLLWLTCSMAEALGWDPEDFPLDFNGDDARQGYADMTDAVAFSAQAIVDHPEKALAWFESLPPSLTTFFHHKTPEFSAHIRQAYFQKAWGDAPTPAYRKIRM